MKSERSTGANVHCKTFAVFVILNLLISIYRRLPRLYILSRMAHLRCFIAHCKALGAKMQRISRVFLDVRKPLRR